MFTTNSWEAIVLTVNDFYIALLVAGALLYSVMFVRCVMALIKNHLQQRTRFLMWGSGFYTFWMAHLEWVHSIDRITMHVAPIVRLDYDFFSLVMTTIGIIVIAVTLEYSAQRGVINSDVRRREDDPKGPFNKEID